MSVALFVLAGAMLWIRVSPFIVASAVMIGLYFAFASGHVEYAVYDLWAGLNLEALFAIPVLLLVSALLASEVMSDRIVDFLNAICDPLPGGSAIAAVFSMAFVAALSGSPSIAILLLGPALLRLLTDAGHTRAFGIGLLCSSSLCGVLLPPSLSFVLYGAVTDLSAQSLYLSAMPLAVLLIAASAGFCVVIQWRDRSTSWSWSEIKTALVGASPVWLGTLALYAAVYARVLSVVQAGVLFLIAFLVIETVVYRRLSLGDLKVALVDLSIQLGRTLPLVALSVSLMTFLIYQQVPAQFADIFLSAENAADDNLWRAQRLFVVGSNVLLLIVGSAMALDTSVLLSAALLHETAEALALEPSRFGAMVVFNLSLGLLTPPSGLVLIAAMIAFKENMMSVVRAIAPFYAMLSIALGIACANVLFS